MSKEHTGWLVLLLPLFSYLGSGCELLILYQLMSTSSGRFGQPDDTMAIDSLFVSLQIGFAAFAINFSSQ